MRTSPVRPAGSFLAASISRNLKDNQPELMLVETYWKNVSETRCLLALEQSKGTHDDFPLPVAPIMAFKPGFIIPLSLIPEK